MTPEKCSRCGQIIPKDQVSCPHCGRARNYISENCCTNKNCSGYIEILPRSCAFCPICHAKTAEQQFIDLLC